MTSSSGLTTRYLTKLCQLVIPKTFSRVVSCDMMRLAFPSYKKSRGAIVNTLEARYKTGGHWVAVFYDEPTDKFHFYDPYGVDYKLNKEMVAFFRRSKKKVKCHRQIVQALQSTFCGFHSLAFLIHLEEGVATRRFFRLYTASPQSSTRPSGDKNSLAYEEELATNDDISVELIKARLKQNRS